MSVFMDRVLRGNLGFIKVDITLLVYKTIDFSLRSSKGFYTIPVLNSANGFTISIYKGYPACFRISLYCTPFLMLAVTIITLSLLGFSL